VVARPPSGLYRFQKLIRRNKLAFTAGTAVTAVLVLGVVVSTWQAVRAWEAEQAATMDRSRAEQQAHLAAQEATRAALAAASARRFAYAAEINVGLQALAEHNLGHARELLNRQQPTAGAKGTAWQAHGDAIGAVAFTSDGKRIATGTIGGEVKI